MTIYETIQKVIDFDKQVITLPSGKTFNYQETLKRINCYINNRFLEREDGIFWNISSSRIVHFAKNIDLDTKDLQPYADGEVSYAQTWILKMKFYRWLEDNHFALVLNDRSNGLSTYGSWVWKVVKVDGKKHIESVDLTKLYFDRTVKNLRDTDIAYEHTLTKREIEDKKDVWVNVEELLRSKPEKDGKYTIYEFWGWCDEGYKQMFYSPKLKDKYLYEIDKKESDCPFYDYHLGDYRGRWLREGVVERLFSLQERVNQLVNQNASYTEISSLLLLRTANPEISGNVLQDVENGEIINSDDLQQIGISNIAFNGFINELREIENKADQICLTPSIISGESMPSGTPFRSVAVLTNAAKSAFTVIRESIGESTGYLLKEVIFPDVVKEWNKGELFEMGRDEADVQYFSKQVRKLTKWRAFVDNLLNGKEMTMEELRAMDESIAEQLGDSLPKIKIPENFFNFKFHIRTQITGESVDKQQRNDALNNTLNWVQSNPAITDIPYFRQYCEENGINYWRLTPEQKADIMARQQQAPQQSQQPSIGQGDKLSGLVDT
jgi:hypothetical protein